jgi:secreted Zn-dependent insulinase-like peptidase
MQRTVEVLLEEYKGAHEKPINHAAYLSTQALSKRFWDIDDRMDCLKSLTFQDFTNFVSNLFSKVSTTNLSPLYMYFV